MDTLYIDHMLLEVNNWLRSYGQTGTREYTCKVVWECWRRAVSGSQVGPGSGLCWDAQQLHDLTDSSGQIVVDHYRLAVRAGQIQYLCL